jgi:hypothetical protein
MTSAAICDCGTFAIGMCVQCGRPVCGDHSQLVDGRRICLACLGARAKQAAAAITSGHAEVIDGLRAIADPVERLLRTTWYVVNATYDVHIERRTGASIDDLYAVFPELAGVPAKRTAAWGPRYKYPPASWDSLAVGRWFVSAADSRKIEPPDVIKLVKIKKYTFGPAVAAEQVLRCWSFHEGADMSGSGVGSIPTAYVLGNGLVVEAKAVSSKYAKMVRLEFDQFTDLCPIDLNLRALAEMADILELKVSQPGLSSMAAWR